jgi:hypothetical protein
VAVTSISSERRVINRWIQLITAIIAMLAISNLQYGRTIARARQMAPAREPSQARPRAA